MEIKTNKAGDAHESGPPPEKSRYLRKKISQKPRKSHIAGRRVIAALKVLGKAGTFLLVVVFMLSVFVYSYTSDKFNLRNITFYGCKEIDCQAMEAAVRQEFPANILRIDLRQLRSRLEREIWAKRVEVRRVLPSDLLIYIQERTPSVILEMHGELMVADSDGTLLDRYDPKYGKLDVPVFKGVLGENAEGYRLYQEENAARIRQGLSMLSAIEAGSSLYVLNISEVDISDKADLKVLLVDDSAEVLLGDKDYLKRFRMLMANLGQYRELKAQYNDIGSVDLRFDGQIIYRPRRAPK